MTSPESRKAGARLRPGPLVVRRHDARRVLGSTAFPQADAGDRAGTVRAGAHEAGAGASYGRSMKSTYAVRWRESDDRVYLGRLELSPTALLLDGLHHRGPAVRRSVGYDELTGVRVARWREEGRNGQPALVVERLGGNLLVTSAVIHAGVVQELVDRLAALALALGSPRRATA